MPVNACPWHQMATATAVNTTMTCVFFLCIYCNQFDDHVTFTAITSLTSNHFNRLIVSHQMMCGCENNRKLKDPAVTSNGCAWLRKKNVKFAYIRWMCMDVKLSLFLVRPFALQYPLIFFLQIFAKIANFLITFCTHIAARNLSLINEVDKIYIAKRRYHQRSCITHTHNTRLLKSAGRKDQVNNGCCWPNHILLHFTLLPLVTPSILWNYFFPLYSSQELYSIEPEELVFCIKMTF